MGYTLVMSSTEYQHSDGDDYVTENVTTDVQTAEMYGHLPYRVLKLGTFDGQLTNDGTDTEMLTVEVVDGLEVAKGTDPGNATVLDYDGDVALSIDGAETTKTLSNGTVSFELTTEKSAGSTIEIVAETLADHPAESDSATIEVIQA